MAVVSDDPLGKNALTWSGRTAGPPCRVCRVNLSEGHRYYQHKKMVIHYCCWARVEAKEKNSVS